MQIITNLDVSAVCVEGLVAVSHLQQELSIVQQRILIVAIKLQRLAVCPQCIVCFATQYKCIYYDEMV